MAQQGSETILEEAKNLLVQGKRFMALEDYQSATDSLEQSCQLFDAFYGVAKRECADAYLEYGLALVALANVESGSGTDKLMKKAGISEGDEEQDEAEDEEAEDEEEADGEVEQEDVNQVQEDKQESDEAKTADCVDTETKDEAKTNGSEPTEPQSNPSNGTNTNGLHKTQETNDQPMEPQASGSSSADPKPGTSGDNDQDSIEDEEPSNIEIAWEVLCLAKRLYMTDESLEGRLKLAETLQKIGEISIEWDNNDNAVSILEECLNLRKAILPPEDRLIALTYYHLGLAHSFKSETQQANQNFQNAINVIEKRIASLTMDLAKSKEAQDTVSIGTYQKEINELKELLPDMTMRLDDSKDDGDKSTEVLKRTREEMQLEDEEAKKVCSDKSKPVDDISHLVKRKAA